MSVAIENTKPGVTAIVNAGQVSRPLERQPTSTAFVIGFATWGPAGVATKITSFSEYRRVFGNFHEAGYLAEFAKIFFDHFGGKQMVAVRAVGPAAAEGTVTVNNRVAVTPAATFKFDAKHPSADGVPAVTISDVAGSTDLVDLLIKYDALGITERYLGIDLRVDANIALVNAKSKVLNVSLAAAIVAGATGRPAAGTFNLAGGADDAGSVEDIDLPGYLSEFADENFGTGQVAIPGHGDNGEDPDEAIALALIAHAEAYNRLALIDPELGTEWADAVTEFGTIASSHAAAYFPWVEMIALDGSGGKKFYPPSCFAAGACALVDRTIGTHKAPANIMVPNAVDVERNDDGTTMMTDNVREVLNASNINAIAPIAGEGIKIYGARVLAPSGETRVRFVHERRLLNLIYYTAKFGFAWAVFAVVDGGGRLFRDLRSSGQNFLRSLWRAGALFGATEDEAFVVTADESNNPPEELQEGRVHVQLGVKLSPTAEVVIVNIDSVPLAENLNVLNGGAN